MRDPVGSARLPDTADVVVVGGGCMGTSTAWHLARRGLGVVLLEKSHVAAGATGHSGALVRQHYEARIGIRLAKESLAFFRRFKEETGFSCDFRTTGFLSGTRERDLPAFEALIELLRSEGVRAERLTPSDARTMEPQLEVSDYAALVHDPDAGYADPIATAHGFAGSRRVVHRDACPPDRGRQDPRSRTLVRGTCDHRRGELDARPCRDRQGSVARAVRPR